MQLSASIRVNVGLLAHNAREGESANFSQIATRTCGNYTLMLVFQ
jgi:hypothetical protein